MNLVMSVNITKHHNNIITWNGQPRDTGNIGQTKTHDEDIQTTNTKHDSTESRECS